MKLADSRIFTIASKNFERLSRAARSTPRRLARLRFKNDAAVKLGLRKMRPTTHTHARTRPSHRCVERLLRGPRISKVRGDREFPPLLKNSLPQRESFFFFFSHPGSVRARARVNFQGESRRPCLDARNPPSPAPSPPIRNFTDVLSVRISATVETRIR